LYTPLLPKAEIAAATVMIPVYAGLDMTSTSNAPPAKAAAGTLYDLDPSETTTVAPSGAASASSCAARRPTASLPICASSALSDPTSASSASARPTAAPRAAALTTSANPADRESAQTPSDDSL